MRLFRGSGGLNRNRLCLGQVVAAHHPSWTGRTAISIKSVSHYSFIGAISLPHHAVAKVGAVKSCLQLSKFNPGGKYRGDDYEAD